MAAAPQDTAPMLRPAKCYTQNNPFNIAERTLPVPCLLRAALSLLLACLLPLGTGDADSQACADAPLRFGFYASFPPVSYSADADPEAANFNSHRGYEADLLSALEALDGTGLAFQRQAIPLWQDIWLQAASPRFDMVGGGISILDARRLDAAGDERVTFTSGHIAFQQSLLARAEDAQRINSYDAIEGALRLGVYADTTGETRLLETLGYITEDGALVAGIMVETPRGTVNADGSADYAIGAAGATANVAGRQALRPLDETMPAVIYLAGGAGESAITELHEALLNGDIDAFAQAQLGNSAAAIASEGALVVSALDAALELGGFALAVEDAALAECISDRIDWLTDGGSIGYAQWLADATVFLRRAQLWNERESGGV